MDPSTITDPVLGRPAVLIVDDHPLTRSLLGRALGATGCTVRLAADGAEALEVLGDHQVDLVLSDVSMPRLDGPELARRIRALPVGPPVVLMSTDPDADPRLPGVPFLSKPVPFDTLYRLVDELGSA